MSTPEGKVKDMVRRTMRQAYPTCYRFMPVQNGMGAPALDFYYCVRGVFVAIETKAPGKKVTPRQQQTIEEIDAAGGIAVVVSDEKSMDAAIKHIDKAVFRCA